MYVTNVMTRAKYYGQSQPNMGGEPPLPKNYFHIDKNEAIPCIHKLLKALGQQP